MKQQIKLFIMSAMIVASFSLGINSASAYHVQAAAVGPKSTEVVHRKTVVNTVPGVVGTAKISRRGTSPYVVHRKAVVYYPGHGRSVGRRTYTP